MEHPLPDLRNTSPFPVHLSWGSLHSQAMCFVPHSAQMSSPLMLYIHSSFTGLYPSSVLSLKNNLHLVIHSKQLTVINFPTCSLLISPTVYTWISLPSRNWTWWGMKVILFIVIYFGIRRMYIFIKTGIFSILHHYILCYMFKGGTLNLCHSYRNLISFPSTFHTHKKTWYNSWIGN